MVIWNNVPIGNVMHAYARNHGEGTVLAAFPVAEEGF